MKEAKRIVKSKEEVIAELRNNSVFMGKMAFIKEKLWPALLESTTSIEDACQLLAGFNTQIMQEFLGQMKNKQTSELNLEEKLDKTSPKHEQHKALVALFKDMSVFDTKDYVEGLKSEIELFKAEEMQSRSLSTLKTRWMDEI